MHAPERADVFEREIEFHDRLAARLDPADMPAEPLDVFDPVVVREIGDVAGRRVLDVGCGDGTLALVMAKAGAKVTAFDLSPGMVEIARRRAELHVPDAEIEFHAAAFEEVDLPDGAFDLVVGKFILHHVDLAEAAGRVRRWLAPGGEAYFLETSAFNPLLSFARRAVAGRFGTQRFGTEDEHPLTRADVDAFTRHFAWSHVDHPIMHFIRMIDRHVLKWRFESVTRGLIRADVALWNSVPRARSLSYYVGIRVRP